eukprot:m.32121 g.32121  ORF g.32121 m.32121 type:complete len:82 (+) comp9366_c1_seq1:261-506(+)
MGSFALLYNRLLVIYSKIPAPNKGPILLVLYLIIISLVASPAMRLFARVTLEQTQRCLLSYIQRKKERGEDLSPARERGNW